MDHKKSRVDQKQNKKTSLLLNYLRKSTSKFFFLNKEKVWAKCFAKKICTTKYRKTKIHLSRKITKKTLLVNLKKKKRKKIPFEKSEKIKIPCRKYKMIITNHRYIYNNHMVLQIILPYKFKNSVKMHGI